MCNCLYCKLFLRVDSLQHSFSEPFKRMWFWLPKRIYNRNLKEKTFLGFVIYPEYGSINYYWWRDLKYIKTKVGWFKWKYDKTK